MMIRLVCLAIGYVCGLFQTSYLIGKKKHIDIREHGSGNAGSTNAMRVMGKKAGALTLLGDLLKGVVATLIVRALFGASHRDMLYLLCMYGGAGCILGHNFPFYLNFRGGKGFAASVGMVLGLDLRLFGICAVVFFGMFFLTHYVSLCSISAYLTALVLMIVFGNLGMLDLAPDYLTETYILMGCLTVLAIFRHRANIRRLLDGTESRTYLKK